MSTPSIPSSSSTSSTHTRLPYVIDPSLRKGEIRIPSRPIGTIGPELPVHYPTEWPDYITEAMQRRGPDQPLRVYADGIYDITHYGHFRSVEQAKKAFPNVYLLVGCCDDAITHANKGITVFNEIERYESLRHCKWIDEVIPNAPWVITKEFLEKHDIDFVCHDDIPYVSGNISDVYGHLKEMKKFHATQRTEGVSTTDIIIRILRNYDDLIKRNVSRGITLEEMNVSAGKIEELGLKK